MQKKGFGGVVGAFMNELRSFH